MLAGICCFWTSPTSADHDFPSLKGSVAVHSCVYLQGEDGWQLSMDIFLPSGDMLPNQHAAMVFFHGGSWQAGSPAQFHRQARALAEAGMVCFTPSYRLQSTHGTTPMDAVADARSAIRWVKQNAGRFGIDANKVYAGGGSAGGHLALMTALGDGFDHGKDDLSISPIPSGLVLFNPVLDISPAGFGYPFAGQSFPAISPFHNLRAGLPPMILLLGTEDHVLPVTTARTFVHSSRSMGNQVSLHLYPGQKHGFFNFEISPAHFEATLQAMLSFLRKEGALPGWKRETLLCFGDSITANGGWLDHLRDKLPIQLLQAGRSGRKTTDVRKELPSVLQSHPEADGLLFLLGVNDLPARDTRSLQEKVDSCTANMELALLLALDRFTPAQVLLASPTAVFPDKLSLTNLEKGYQITPPILKQLDLAYQKLAIRKGVPFISLLEAIGPEGCRDGLHPNDDGDRAIAERLHFWFSHPKPKLPRHHLPSFYLVGDSISINYHEHLVIECHGHLHYSRKGGLSLAKADLDSARGANGGDSSMVLEHLKDLVGRNALEADIVVINCGLHDIKTNPQTGHRQVGLDQYRRNLQEIINLLGKARKRMVWVNTTPLDEERHQRWQTSFHRYEDDLAIYNAAAAEIMNLSGVPIIDLNGYTSGLGHDLYRDHVHFQSWVSRHQAAFLRSELTALIYGDQRLLEKQCLQKVNFSILPEGDPRGSN